MGSAYLVSKTGAHVVISSSRVHWPPLTHIRPQPAIRETCQESVEIRFGPFLMRPRRYLRQLRARHDGVGMSDHIAHVWEALGCLIDCKDKLMAFLPCQEPFVC